jgi:hypothetical protein
MDRSSRISGSSDLDRPKIAEQAVELMPAASGEDRPGESTTQPGRASRPDRAHQGEPQALDVLVDDIFGCGRYAQ